MIDLEKVFEKHKDEYLEFKREQTPKHPRRDISAFILLHELVPLLKNNSRNMILSARYNQVWLDADINTVAKNATEEQIVTLIRCGVHLDIQKNALSMFV